MNNPPPNFVLAPALEQLATWTLEHRPAEPQMWKAADALVETLGQRVGNLRVWRRHMVIGESVALRVCLSDETAPLQWEGLLYLGIPETGSAWARAWLLAFYDDVRIGPTQYEGQATYLHILVERDGRFGWRAAGWAVDAHKEYFGVTSRCASPAGSEVKTTYG